MNKQAYEYRLKIRFIFNAVKRCFFERTLILKIVSIDQVYLKKAVSRFFKKCIELTVFRSSCRRRRCLRQDVGCTICWIVVQHRNGVRMHVPLLDRWLLYWCSFSIRNGCLVVHRWQRVEIRRGFYFVVFWDHRWIVCRRCPSTYRILENHRWKLRSPCTLTERVDDVSILRTDPLNHFRLCYSFPALLLISGIQSIQCRAYSVEYTV